MDAAASNLETMIVCPHCDALYVSEQPGFGERAVCGRCHAVLITPRKQAGMQIIMLALAILVLVISAGVFPFLSIEAAGARNSVSVIDAALAFSGGWLYFVALATATLILVIPLLRVLLVLYVLVPVVFDYPPAKGANRAFNLSETLRPWSMAEIFAIGCAVALVKVVDLADVSFGPAFWMFAVLVVLVVVQDRFMCRWSIWNSLSPKQKS